MSRIYVDLDDVLARTIDALAGLLERHFGRRVEVEAVRHFDLGRSFGLARDELAEFMRLVHRPEELARLAPHAGGAEVLGGWLERGHEVAVMTGRPPSTEAASRRWLERHAIPHTELASVDKYGRPDEDGGAALPLEALAERDFALAVEDSLEMAAHLAGACGLPVALVDRPWNRDTRAVPPQAAARIVRCRGWAEIAARFPSP